MHQVVGEGLDPRQQAELRHVARGHPLGLDELHQCGLIDTDGQLADPVLAAHFRPAFVLHHISDLHFGPKTASGVDAKQPGRLADAVGGSVRDDYLRRIAAETHQPHAVVISGDLVETGQPEQYTDAAAWVSSLHAVLNRAHPDLRDDPRVCLVGGNHDVDWSAGADDAAMRARHAPFARAFPALPRPPLEEEPATRPLVTVCFPGVGVEIVLLGSAELGGELADERAADELRTIAAASPRAPRSSA